jgi:hypothetical protein
MITLLPKASDILNNQQSTDLTVFDEIRTIERSILVAAKNGDLETIVSDTTMTTSELYYNVSEGLAENRVIKNQLQTVETYFKDKKYAISKQSHGKYIITGISVNNPGKGYNPGDILTLNTINNITDAYASINVVSTQMVDFNIAVGGIGYSVGDIITATNGVAISPTTAVVSSVDNQGSVLQLTMLNKGEYTTLPGLLGTTTSTLGFGSGLVLTSFWGIKNVSLNNSGGFSSSPASPVNVSGGTNVIDTASLNFIVGAGNSITFNWKLQW